MTVSRLTCTARSTMLSGLESHNGPSTLNEDQIAERGARMARRDDREYREYLREEQRREPGCPAREVVLDQRGQATSHLATNPTAGPLGASASMATDGRWTETQRRNV